MFKHYLCQCLRSWAARTVQVPSSAASKWSGLLCSGQQEDSQLQVVVNPEQVPAGSMERHQGSPDCLVLPVKPLA